MEPAESKDPASSAEEPEVTYHHRRGVILTLVLLLSGLLGLLAFAAYHGPRIDPDTPHRLWGLVLGLLLLGILVPFLWMLWRRPAVMIVGRAGLHLPLAFTRPLRWDEMHRIRLVSQGRSFYGHRQWLIVDPSPGVLAPIRLKSWRRLDLWFQRHHGVRIPLHGLDAEPDEIVRSIARHRRVIRDSR